MSEMEIGTPRAELGAEWWFRAPVEEFGCEDGADAAAEDVDADVVSCLRACLSSAVCLTMCACSALSLRCWASNCVSKVCRSLRPMLDTSPPAPPAIEGAEWCCGAPTVGEKSDEEPCCE